MYEGIVSFVDKFLKVLYYTSESLGGLLNPKAGHVKLKPLRGPHTKFWN